MIQSDPNLKPGGNEMSRLLKPLLAALLSAVAVPALADDRIVDVSNVRSVAALLQEAGYRAVIKSNDDKKFYIESAANGGNFSVNFYGCKEDANCDSFEFHAWYKKQPQYTAALANDWNESKRFLKLSIDKDGDLNEYLYVSAVGKMTYANFVDYVEWFTFMDGELSKFLSERAALTNK